MHLDNFKKKYTKHEKCYKNADNELFYSEKNLFDVLKEPPLIIQEIIFLLKVSPIKIVNSEKYINLYTYQSMLLIKKYLKKVENLRKNKESKDKNYFNSAFNIFASNIFMVGKRKNGYLNRF
tara:strand:- start:362 stop:727 length:366 start_codon:yes stop_codon:yes gene_type:complete